MRFLQSESGSGTNEIARRCQEQPRSAHAAVHAQVAVHLLHRVAELGRAPTSGRGGGDGDRRPSGSLRRGGERSADRASRARRAGRARPWRPRHRTRREPVVPAALVVERGIGALLGLLDQAVGEQPLDRAVERAGAQLDRAVAEGVDVADQRVAVALTPPEGEEDVQRGGLEGSRASLTQSASDISGHD